MTKGLAPGTLRMLSLLLLLVVGLSTPCPAGRRPQEEQRRASTDAEEGLDWLQRRRTFTMNQVPYGLTGLPIIFYTPSSGLHYGGWVEVADYSARPYRYRINVQWWLSTLGKRDHHIRFESPEVFGLPFSIRLMTQDLKDIGAAYYGVGNDTKMNQDSLAINRDYYRYQLEQQKTGLDIEARLGGSVALFAGARFKRGAPTRVNEARSDYLVFRDPRLPGLEAGWTNFLVAGILFDTRDDQELPTKGILAELSVQKAYKSLGTDYPYRRITFIYSHYIRLHPTRRSFRYVLLVRTLFENLEGEIPFYEETEVGGSIRGFEVGGNTTMRGYESRRFADKQKVLLTIEMRRVFRERSISGQYLQTQGIAFVDLGRVGSRLSDLTPAGVHPSIGVGSRLVWNSQLSLRLDFALSPEGHRFLLTFGNLF
jgi:hypothetical protein